MPKARARAKNLYLRGGTYYARVQVKGRDRRISLQTSDRAEARRAVKALMERAERERAGDLSDVSFVDAVRSWADVGFGVNSSDTRDRYRTSLLMLRPMFQTLKMHQITRRRVGDYVNARAKAGAKHATIRRDLTALSGLLRHCVARGWRDDNPAHEWDRRAIPETREPMQRVCMKSYRACIAESSPAWASMLRFLLASGLRLNVDALNLRREAVNWATGVATFVTKRNRIRTRQLSASAMAALSELPASTASPFVFWQLRGNSARMKLSRSFEDIVKRAKARALREGWVYVPFPLHNLRHEFAIEYLKHGGAAGAVGSIYTLQGLLGHTSVKTTETYLDFLTAEEVALAKGSWSAQIPAQHPRFSGGDA